MKLTRRKFLAGLALTPFAPLLAKIPLPTDGFMVGMDVASKGSDYIAYCWGPSPGFRKLASYKGGGPIEFVDLEDDSEEGPPMEPDMVWIKNPPNDDKWRIFDRTRDRSNDIDFLSDGFRIRGKG